MEWQELLAAVGRFGLGEREAQLYLVLLRRGRATARELSRETQIDRVLGYRILEGMRAKGVVDVTAERPRRFAPVPPSAFFERNLRERRTALAKDASIAADLAKQLSALEAPGASGAPRYQMLTGTSRIYDYLEEMVGRARREISVMLTSVSMRESMDAGLQRRIGQFVETGGRFRLIVESDPRLRITLARFSKTLRRYPRAEFRQMAPQSTRLTIVDRSEALLFLVPEARDRRSDQIAVWTDNPEFVTGHSHFFDTAWERSGSASLRPTGSARVSEPPGRAMGAKARTAAAR